jgi:hypothetical protein
MDIDFDKIREENIIEYGAGVKHLSFLGRLYADKTHFIFELLQNAEDANAKKIKFVLYHDRLEVLHDGKIFNADKNKDDVRGICGIDESTKSDDLTQIGKFGIGFKSVYAFSQVPEVHCKGIHFKIEHYVRPYKIESRYIESNFTTLFAFPFTSTEEKDISRFQQKSFDQISNRLQKLSVRTLLFLRNLEEIEYEIDEGITGIYLRENKSKKAFRYITVIGQQENMVIDEQWIVFSKPISEIKSTLNVEVAFKIEQNKDNEVTVSRLKQSCLNVFFPTEKETHLGFLVQGPYRTTPARDNIPQDDDWNRKLVKETAELLQNSLEILKKEGLLNVNLLETLPLKTDEYSESWMFWPIYEAAKKAFIDNALLPTTDNNFVSAANAKLARGKGLRALIDNDKLSDMFESNSSLKWLSGKITQDRTPILRQYLIYELDIEEIDPESFARKITYNFLKKRSDDWHIKFYDFLRGQEALWRKGHYHIYDGTLRKKPIIRCQDGENYPAYSPKGRPLVFLPVSSEMNFLTVAPNIYANEKAKFFLDNFGLVKPDICATVLNKILPSFRQNELLEDFKLEGYQESVDLIDDATLLNDSPLYTKLIKQLMTVPWIFAENLSGENQLKMVSEVYIPSEELYMYFEDNEDIWFVSNEIQIREELLLQVGASNQIKIHCKGLKRYSKKPFDEIALWSLHGNHGIGLRCFDHRTSVDGLEKAIETINVDKAIYIWNTFATRLSNFIMGEIKTATRQDFKYAKIKKYYSAFGSLVVKSCWVPTIDGDFKKPSDCYIEDLHYDLKKDDQLLKKLEIYPSPSSLKSKADEEFHSVFSNQGISKDIADFIINNKTSLSLDFLEEALTISKERQAKSKPTFPTQKSKNPEYREGKIRTKHDKGEDKSYIIKERSVKESRPNHDPKTWLRDHYTNEDQVLVCQMCANEMPFKLKNGFYHFEAVQISDNLTKEGHELYLAFCPICAAKYRILVKKNTTLLNDFLTSIKNVEENLEIPVDLGINGLHNVHFVETHLQDLKNILNYEDELVV